MSTRYSIDPIHMMGLPFLGDDVSDEPGQLCTGTIHIVATPSASPIVAGIRVPYTSGGIKTIIGCKDVCGTDRDLVRVGAGDSYTIGNSCLDLRLNAPSLTVEDEGDLLA